MTADEADCFLSAGAVLALDCRLISWFNVLSMAVNLAAFADPPGLEAFVGKAKGGEVALEAEVGEALEREVLLPLLG